MKKTLLLGRATLLFIIAIMWGGDLMAQKTLPYSYGFEDNDLSTDSWTTSDCLSGSKITIGSKKTGDYGFNFYYSSSQSQYLISPQLSTTSYGVNVSFYYKNSSAYTDMYFKVGYSKTTNAVSSFSWDATATKANKGADWASYSNIFPDDANYIAIQLLTAGSYCNLYIDDFSFTEAEACPTPTDFKAISYTATTTTFEWSATPTQSAWLIYYSTSNDTPDNEKVSGDGIVTVTSNPYTLEGLTEETNYHAWIRGNCTASDNGYSSWSSVCDFTPSKEVDLNLYTDAATTNDYVPFYAKSVGSGIGTSNNIEAQFIIPSTDMSSAIVGGTIKSLTFYSSYDSDTNFGNAEFDVKISEVNYASFSTATLENITDAALYSDTLSYSNGKLKITLDTPYFYKGGNLIIHIKLKKNGTNVSMTWTNKTTTGYQSIYSSKFGSTTRHSKIPQTTITYVPAPKFTTAGDWNEASNWTPSEIPATNENVVINAAATIPSGYNAQASNIIIGSGSLTIADGGQLICGNSVAATVQKDITASTAKSGEGWYTIASSVNNPAITSGTNLTDGTYDLYRFEESEQEKPWENYKAHSSTDFTTLENGRGYLYRNGASKTLSFTGNTNVGDVSCSVSNSGGDFAGFNLIGNPYPHNIYKGAGTAIPNSVTSGYELATGFHTLTNEGAWSTGTDNSTAILPGQGIMVEATKAGTLTILDKTSSSGSKYNSEYIRFTVENAEYSDDAYAWFDKGYGLHKIDHRNPVIPMLYIPQDGEDYSIAIMKDNTEAFGLNFKANTIGSYTLKYKTKGSFDYLHVIDRLTGEDIDMLLDGEYSFVGSTQDDEARFIVKLAYKPNYSSSDETAFAYQSGSEIFVSGEGELQVFDVTGRIVSTETINGVKAVSVPAQGVYVFRLVGENVKTQKIVVR